MVKVNTELTKEKKVISSLEKYMKYNPGESVVILDYLDFCFSQSELSKIKELWLHGSTVPEISKKLNRDENEVFLALFHLSFENRKNGTENIILSISQIRGE